MSCQSELCKSNDFIYLNHTKSSSSSPDVALAPVPGTVAGEVKLSILYKSDKLFIMVMHIRGLVSVWRCSYSYAHNARKKRELALTNVLWTFLQQPLQDGTDPDPYVKLYLLPDPQKTSKRKTKAARRTCNPTYNEMVR